MSSVRISAYGLILAVHDLELSGVWPPRSRVLARGHARAGAQSPGWPPAHAAGRSQPRDP